MDEEIKKRADEDWKAGIEKEKEALKKQGKSIPPPEVDFNFFITTLALQASIGLGQVPNPVTNQKEEELNQAKFLIDTLGMLKEKTEGNLNQDETNLLENLLYELRTQYIAKSEGAKNNGSFAK